MAVSIISRVSGITGDYVPHNYYTFTLDSTQFVNLDSTVSYGNNTLSLYNAAGSLIANSSGGAGSDGWINRTLAAGTYYVDVSGSDNSIYTLTTSFGTPTIGSIAVDSAGGTLATARALGMVGTAGVVVADAIGGSDTVDYYAFNVASTSLVNILLSGVSNYTNLYLTDASGRTIYSTSATSTQNGSINQVLPYLTPGTYFVAVTGSVYNSPYGYNLSVTSTPVVTTAGATAAAARSIGILGTATQTFSDVLSSVAPTEYYSFSLAGPSSVKLVISGLTDNTTMTLRDASGNSILTTSGNSTTGSADITTYLANLTLGTYSVSISSSLYPTLISPYTLTAQATAIVDPGGNTFATATQLGALGTTPVVKAGYLGTVNPNDYYTFTLASAATVNVKFGATYDEYLTLLSASGSTLNGSIHESYGTLYASYTLSPGTYTFLAQPASGEDEQYTFSVSTASPSVGNSASTSAGTTIGTAKSLGTMTATPVDVAEWVGTGNTDDWYTIILPVAETLQADVWGSTGALNLFVLNASGTQITSDYGYASTLNGGSVVTGASTTKALAAGTYYVRVQNPSSSYNSGYHLAVSAAPSGGGSAPDVAGNSTSTGINIGTLGTTAQTFTDYIGSTDTDDYFQFTIAATSTVNLSAHSESYSGTSTTLYLRDISGNQIDYGYEYYHNSAFLQHVLTPGIYFADVRNSNANIYTLTMSATPVAGIGSSALSTAVGFLPTAAGLAAQIDSLEAQVKAGGLTSITLADAGVPTISITYAQAVADIDVLKAITTPYVLNLSATPERYAGPTLTALGLGSSAAKWVQFADGRLVYDTSDPAAQVYRMYLSAFGRLPEPTGQHHWIQKLETGTTLVSMAQGFIVSSEFISRYGSNLSDAAYITLLYQNVLGRTPESAGLQAWQAALAGGQTRAQVLVSFSESPENINATAGGVKTGQWDLDEEAAQVGRLYDTVFGRLPDTAGLALWSATLRAGSQTLTSVATAFVGSAEFQAAYSGLDNAGFVNKLYVNSLHRVGETAGVNGWVAQLNAGATRASVVLGFSESVEHQNNTAPNIINSNASQSGVLSIGSVIASGSVVSSQLDALESQVKARTITSLALGGNGTAAVAVTAAQLSSDKDALSALTGSFYLDMRTISAASGAAAVTAANLGNTTSAKYVQFADGRLVFDTTDRAAQVYRMYDSAFGRAPDNAGAHLWDQILSSGTTLATVAQSFLDSAEFTNRYGASLSDSAYITQLYANVLHRAPDTAGLNSWLTTLRSGNTSRAQMLTNFSESSEHVGNTAAAIRLGTYDLG